MIEIFPSKLSGTLSVPPSKSQTLRALTFAFMAEGTSTLHNTLSSPDVDAMITACRHLGGQVEREGSTLHVTGVGRIGTAEDVLDAGNSGIVLRFMGAIAALGTFPVVLTGDHSIRHRRPAQPLLDGLRQLGVQAESMRGDGFAPLLIRGPLKPGVATIDGADSQPVSALLIAAAFADGTTTLHVEHPGEKPWVDLTLHWFDRLGIAYTRAGHTTYTVAGGTTLEPFTYTIPADFSSAAFPLAAALVTGSELTLTGLDFSDPQGDKAFFDVLQEMGAALTCDGDSVQLKPSALRGGTFDLNPLIDTLPVLASLACFASSPTHFYGVVGARAKESDRIGAMAHELRTMGGVVEEHADGLTVHPAQLQGGAVGGHADHRVAMALTVAALGARGSSTLAGGACVAKTYPTFFEDLKSVGGVIR